MPKNVDNNARFWAYSNYLIAFYRLINTEYPTLNDLISSITSSSGFLKIYRGTSINYDNIAQSLRLSWYTELLLTKTTPHKDILPYSTPWSMVQTYYAIYPAIRAYFITMGRNVDTSHETSLRTIGSDLINCKGRFPYPWNCVHNNDPNKKIFSLLNDPYNTVITQSNPLLSPYNNNPREYFGLLLRTTRERILEKKIKQWKKDGNKKRITKAEKDVLIHNLRPTNFLDILYRVRSRSNYQDIDSFAFTNITDFDYQNLQNAMCGIVDSTLAVFETIITKAIGKNSYKKIVNDFSKMPLGNDNGKTYQKRWDIISKSF